jgi:hypothetical protein
VVRIPDVREAARGALNLKTFVQENERMRRYLQTIESMVREVTVEAMTVSARSHQSDMHDHDHFLPVRDAADDSPAAGAEAD